MPALGIIGTALVLLYKRSHRVDPYVNPPSQAPRTGPIGELVQSLGEAAYARSATSAPTGEFPGLNVAVLTEGRVRGLVLHHYSKRLKLTPAEIATRAARGGDLRSLDAEVVSFLAGESADARWRRRALERYRGSRWLFPLWYHLTVKRRIPPTTAYLRDLAIILRKIEAEEAAETPVSAHAPRSDLAHAGVTAQPQPSFAPASQTPRPQAPGPANSPANAASNQVTFHERP